MYEFLEYKPQMELYMSPIFKQECSRGLVSVIAVQITKIYEKLSNISPLQYYRSAARN